MNRTQEWVTLSTILVEHVLRTKSVCANLRGPWSVMLIKGATERPRRKRLGSGDRPPPQIVAIENFGNAFCSVFSPPTSAVPDLGEAKLAKCDLYHEFRLAYVRLATVSLKFMVNLLFVQFSTAASHPVKIKLIVRLVCIFFSRINPRGHCSDPKFVRTLAQIKGLIKN